MIKALFFDVDGTLVSFKTHKIPERTIQALQMAHDQGGEDIYCYGATKAVAQQHPGGRAPDGWVYPHHGGAVYLW